MQEYPEIPQFLNYLYVWYQERDEREKSREVTLEMINKFPDYLFGKLSLALEYINEGKLTEVEVLLGSSFDIGKLIPQRKVFHISEVTSLLQLAIEYNLAKGDIARASEHVIRLEKIDADKEVVMTMQLKVMSAVMIKKDIQVEKRSKRS